MNSGCRSLCVWLLWVGEVLDVVDHRAAILVMYINDLQSEMRHSGIWSELEPDQNALMSDQPFCVDTLPFEQWLQFVMIPRFNWMIAEQMTLPIQCDVTSMAEETFKLRKLDSVILRLKSIDELLSVS